MNPIHRSVLFGFLIDFTGVIIVAVTVLYATGIDWDFDRSVALGPLDVSSGVAILVGFVAGLAAITIGFTQVLRGLREMRQKP